LGTEELPRQADEHPSHVQPASGGQACVATARIERLIDRRLYVRVEGLWIDPAAFVEFELEFRPDLVEQVRIYRLRLGAHPLMVPPYESAANDPSRGQVALTGESHVPAADYQAVADGRAFIHMQDYRRGL
jgi:hypothetical protein